MHFLFVYLKSAPNRSHIYKRRAPVIFVHKSQIPNIFMKRPAGNKSSKAFY